MHVQIGMKDHDASLFGRMDQHASSRRARVDGPGEPIALDAGAKGLRGGRRNDSENSILPPDFAYGLATVRGLLRPAMGR